jgi:hypothetical protein
MTVMSGIITVGLDLAKNVFQAHGELSLNLMAWTEIAAQDTGWKMRARTRLAKFTRWLISSP